jgi:hypothetical protein
MGDRRNGVPAASNTSVRSGRCDQGDRNARRHCLDFTAAHGLENEEHNVPAIQRHVGAIRRKPRNETPRIRKVGSFRTDKDRTALEAQPNRDLVDDQKLTSRLIFNNIT